MTPIYIAECPIGCTGPLDMTSIVLSEGPLSRCAGCGQLVSRCSEERYQTSMSEFNDPRGTLPKPDSAERRFKRSRKCLLKIARTLNKPSHEIHLLDVGDSTGYFLSVACREGFVAEGVEPAPLAAQAACAAGLRVHQGLPEDLCLPANTFDAVTLFKVIEHVKHPVPLLKECHRIIRPGGLLVIGTGNAASWTASLMKVDWEYFHIAKHGGHVSFFNPVSVRRLAERIGFRVVSLKTNGVRFLEKGDRSPVVYRTAKIVAELLNGPSKLFGKGHDMMAFLKRLS
jgi:2-polyprenyl-3-methyl-5-hydroxy-6-metoxy-1,4-benzoquinol methylase